MHEGEATCGQAYRTDEVNNVVGFEGNKASDIATGEGLNFKFLIATKISISMIFYICTNSILFYK